MKRDKPNSIGKGTSAIVFVGVKKRGTNLRGMKGRCRGCGGTVFFEIKLIA